MSFGNARGLKEEATKGGPRLAAPDRSRTTYLHMVRTRRESSTLVFAIGGSFDRADVARLCVDVRRLLQHDDAQTIVCDVGGVVEPDAVAVDALARLQLIARQRGRNIRFRHACRELRDLLSLTGLAGVLPQCGGELGLEASGQAEEREQGLGVEEEDDPADPVA